MSRLVFPETLKKLQISGNLESKLGSGPAITVMTLAVKKRLVKILIDHNGDLDFKSWEEEIAKDKRFRHTPKKETIRKWWKKECGGIYISKKSRSMISEKTARYLAPSLLLVTRFKLTRLTALDGIGNIVDV